MLAALGLFVFELASFPFDELTRRTGWAHAKSDRFGALAAAQFTGPGADEVTIGGAIVPDAGGKYASIDTLRQMAKEGESYPLVNGAGTVLGQFVIVSMDESHKAVLVDGTPRMIAFSLQLERVG